jgi:hypothetical protein
MSENTRNPRFDSVEALVVRADRVFANNLGGGRTTYRIPILGFRPAQVSGSNETRGFELGTPVNTETGLATGLLAVVVDAVGGDSFTSTALMKRVYVATCTQYSSSPGDRREFFSLFVNGVGVSGCANGIPAGSNNWRVDSATEWAGVQAGEAVRFSTSENSPAVATFNSGNVFVEI